MIDLKDIVIVGLDLSLNSAGIVVIDAEEGTVRATKYITSIKKFVDVGWSGVCEYLPPKVTETKKRVAEDNEIFKARRRNFVATKVIQGLIIAGKTVLVVLEDYAVDSKSTGLLEMAEISGIVRDYCWFRNIHLRTHAPMTVKLWATGGGYAKKMHMVNAARMDGFEIPQALLGDGNKFQFPMDIDGHIHSHDYAGPGTDLADAYHLASLGRCEILIKRSVVKLDKLTESQRKVVLRTTKAYPKNLICRPFVVNQPKENLVTNGTNEVCS